MNVLTSRFGEFDIDDTCFLVFIKTAHSGHGVFLRALRLSENDNTIIGIAFHK
jgi:hypothetical protein